MAYGPWVPTSHLVEQNLLREDLWFFVACSLYRNKSHYKPKGSFPAGDTEPEKHVFLPRLAFVLKKYGLLGEDDSWTDFSTEIYKPLL